eukprot:768572-Hanusia_phi.AAC.6
MHTVRGLAMLMLMRHAVCLLAPSSVPVRLPSSSPPLSSSSPPPLPSSSLRRAVHAFPRLPTKGAVSTLSARKLTPEEEAEVSEIRARLQEVFKQYDKNRDGWAAKVRIRGQR